MPNPIAWPKDEYDQAKTDSWQQGVAEKLAAFNERTKALLTPATEPAQPAAEPWSVDRSGLMPWASGIADAVGQGAQSVAQTAQSWLPDRSALMPWAETPTPLTAATPFTTALAAPGMAPAAASGSPAPMPTGGGGGAALVTGDIDNSSRESFIRTAYPWALQASGGNVAEANQQLAIALSENGDIGTGKDLSQMGFNFSGVHAQDGEKSFMSTDAGRPTAFRAYDNPAQGLSGFMDFLRSNPRYAPALAAYAQTGDIDQLTRDANEAGYSETPEWQDNIRGIRTSQVEPLTRQQTAAPTPTQAEQTPAAQRQALDGITPEQFGLGDADAEAICGPVLAMAFARSNGRNPTIAEAKAIAAQNGGWTSAQGMGGPEAMAATLRAMDIPATYKPGALDIDTMRRETQNGNPVGINTAGHYFVVEGVDDQGRLNLGNSARALRASGGRQWFRPDEIADLGMGEPTGAIYKNNPGSPTPSVAAAPNNALDLARSGQDGLQASALSLKSDGSDDEQPYDPDQGPREALPGSVGAQPLPQDSSQWDTQPQTFDAAPSAIPGPDLSPNGTPITAPVPGFSGAVAPDDGNEAGVREAAPMPQPQNPGLKPVWDAAGAIVGYVQGAADSAYNALEPARQAAASLDGPGGYGQVQSQIGEPDYVSQGGSVIRAMQTPIRPPERRKPMQGPYDLSQMTPEQRQWYDREQPGLKDDVAAIPYQVVEAARSSVMDAAQNFADASTAGEQGRGWAAVGNALWGTLNAAGIPFNTAVKTVDDMFPEANIAGIGPGTVLSVIPDATKLVAAGIKLTPKMVALLQRPEWTADRIISVAESAAPAVNAAREGIETAGRGIGRGARALAEEGAGQLMDLTPSPSVVQQSGGLAARRITETPHVYSPTPPEGVTRRYTGTASAFDAADPAKFDDHGLYGPGYYTTSDPRVANSYAANKSRRQQIKGSELSDYLRDVAARTRQTGADGAEDLARAYESAADDIPPLQPFMESSATRVGNMAPRRASSPLPMGDDKLWGPTREARDGIPELFAPTGANVRAIDIPPGVKMLDVDQPLDPSLIDRVEGVIEQLARTRPELAAPLQDEMAALRRQAQTGANPRNDWLVQGLMNAAERSGAGKGLSTEILERAGFDGIAHTGGQRVPLLDGAGQAIEHDVSVIFPGSVRKVKNAFSGTEGGGYLPFDPASAAAGGAAGAMSEDENGDADPWRTGAGMLFAGVMGPKAKPSPTISKLGQRLMAAYEKVTPARIERSVPRSIQITADSIAGKIPNRGPRLQGSPTELVQQVHEAITRNMADTKTVMTGLRPGALAAYLRGEGLTSKLETRDIGKIDRITQQQVNVEGGRNKLQADGSYKKEPYTIEEAGYFVDRQSAEHRAATSGSRVPDRVTGEIDDDAPRVMYAYVSEGQPLVGPNRPTLWLDWDHTTPRVTSNGHPFGLMSPGQAIHANMPPGQKAANWSPDTIRGGKLNPNGPGGEPIVEGWEKSGVKVAPGRRMADTDWLVGADGEDAMRANTLVQSMPQNIQAQIARGQITDPEQIAAVLMRGGAPQWKSGWAAAISAQRSESLIVDPSLANVRAIYLTATEKNLGAMVPNSGGMTELQVAQKLRADILAQHGKDVPILWTDIAKPGAPTSMADAKVLEGKPVALAPGRQRVVDQYTQAIDPATKKPYTDIGGYLPFDPASAAAGGAAGLTGQDESGDQEFDPLKAAGGMLFAGVAGKAGRNAAHGLGNVPLPSSLNTPHVQRALTAAQRRAENIERRGLTAPSAWDWIKQAGYAGIYGPATAVSSAVGGAQELLMAQPKEAVRALVEGRASSYGAQLKGQVKAMPDGLVGLGRVLFGAGSEGAAAVSGGSQGTANLSERVANPVGHFAARLLERPGEILTEAPDAVFRPMFTAQGMEREARRVASEAGLRGREASAYADELMRGANELKDNPDTPVVAEVVRRVHDAGAEYADQLGYKGKPGGFGQWLGNVAKRDDAIGVLASFLVPFPSMAARMSTAAARSTPGIGLLPSVRRGQASKFDVIYDQAFGTAVAGGLAYWASNGGITGSGPADTEKRKMMMDQGWQPNSVLIGGYYVPNRAFGRFQAMLDTAGEIHDSLAYAKVDRKPSELASELVKRGSKIATDQTGLSGLADLHDMLEGSFASQFPGWAARSAARYVPYAGVLRAAAASSDTAPRKPEGWGDDASPLPAIGRNLQTVVPGLRQQQPATQDSLGREAVNPQAGFGAIIPRTTTAKSDPTIQLFQAAGVDIGAARKEMTVGRSSRIELNPREQRRWNTVRGQFISDYADTYISNPDFMALPPAQKKKYLDTFLTKAADYADKMLQSEMDTDDLTNRATEAAVKKVS